MSKILELLFGKVFFFLLFLYQIVFVFLGIDFSDMGHAAIFYQLIFKDPQSVQYNFAMWLTGVIGGGWYYLFPSFGLVGIRMLGVIIFTSMLVIVFNLLKNHFEEKKLKLGLALLTVLIGHHFTFMGFHYDTVSAFFLLLIIYFLYKGLTDKKNSLIILSGFFLCLNVFSKIPNIAGVAIILPAFYYGFTYKFSINSYIKLLVSFFSGFILGCTFVIILLKLFNHEDVYINSFIETINLGKSGNSYDLFNLFYTYLLQYFQVFLIIATSLVIMAIYLMLANTLTNKIFFSIPLFTAIAIYGIMHESDFMRVKELFVYHGFAILFSIAYLLNTKINFEKRFLIILGLSMLVILPIGCDLGFINMYGLVLFIALPISVCGFFSLTSFRIDLTESIIFSLNQMAVSNTQKSLIVIAIVSAMFSSVYYSYCEGHKTDMTYAVESPQTKAVFTSKERANVVNELLEASKNYVKKDDYVLAYSGIPMYYFLTETKPWLYNIWLPAYSPEQLAYFINKSYGEKHAFPVLVRAKFSTWGNWPQFGLVDSLASKSKWENYLDKELLEKQKYALAWENRAFQIFIPNQKKLFKK